MKKSNGQGRAGQLLGGVNSAVTSSHLISQINVLHLEKKCMKCTKEGHFAQVCKDIAKKGL